MKPSLGKSHSELQFHVQSDADAKLKYEVLSRYLIISLYLYQISQTEP